MLRFVFYGASSAILGLLLLSSHPCFAQSNQLDSISLQTVVIQATRANAQTPVPHTNLSAEKIGRMYQAQDIPFLLSATPSLVETSDAGTGIGYTGMRIRGSDPTRINVTINGIPLNDAESQGVFWVNLPDLAASAAEIQVQRGVGTSTNGAGAFGATVNVDLSRVQAAPFAVLTNSYGSFNTRKHSIYAGSGLLKGKLAFTGRLSGVFSDGFIDRATTNLRSAHLSATYIDDRQSLQAHLLSGREITYQAWYGVPAQYIDDPALRRFNPAGTEKADQPYDKEVDHYTQHHMMLLYKRVLSPSLHLQLNGHYTRGYGYYEQYKADEFYGNYGLKAWNEADTNLRSVDLVRRRWLDNHFFGTTFALRWTPAAQKINVLLGGALSRYLGTHFGVITQTFPAAPVPGDYRYYNNDAQKDDANTYLKAEVRLGSSATVFADMQYRYVHYEFLGFNNVQENVNQQADLHFFNPKAGLNWAFSPHWTVYGFGGIGHREPNRDDYTQSTPESRPRAERLYNLESGLKTRHHKWTAAANIYYMYYRDQLVLDGRLNDVGAYIRANVPESYRAGLELEATAQLGRRWTLSGNAAFSRNKVREFTEYRDNWDNGAQDVYTYQNTDLAFSPNLIARLELGAQLLPAKSRHGLVATLSGKYVGAQYLDNTGNRSTQLPAFRFADLRLNYDLKRLWGTTLNLVVAVNNLFDAHYVSNGWVYRFTSAGYDPRPDDYYARSESGGVYHQAGFFPQAGRHYMATLSLRF